MRLLFLWVTSVVKVWGKLERLCMYWCLSSCFNSCSKLTSVILRGICVLVLKVVFHYSVLDVCQSCCNIQVCASSRRVDAEGFLQRSRHSHILFFCCCFCYCTGLKRLLDISHDHKFPGEYPTTSQILPVPHLPFDFSRHWILFITCAYCFRYSLEIRISSIITLLHQYTLEKIVNCSYQALVTYLATYIHTYV